MSETRVAKSETRVAESEMLSPKCRDTRNRQVVFGTPPRTVKRQQAGLNNDTTLTNSPTHMPPYCTYACRYKARGDTGKVVGGHMLPQHNTCTRVRVWAISGPIKNKDLSSHTLHGRSLGTCDMCHGGDLKTITRHSDHSSQSLCCHHVGRD